MVLINQHTLVELADNLNKIVGDDTRIGGTKANGIDHQFAKVAAAGINMNAGLAFD